MGQMHDYSVTSHVHWLLGTRKKIKTTKAVYVLLKGSMGTGDTEVLWFYKQGGGAAALH